MLASVITTLRWQDAADIAISSYILFRLYVLFRGTNVFRVIAGLVFLWIFQRLSLSLGFIVTSWALRGIIAAAALIIVIVFRNEIRSVLQAKNLQSILWGFSLKNGHSPSETVAEALFELGRNRIGALMVFKSREDLTDVIHPGIPWDGLISKEMILTIFGHENPVHDGAAIVEGDRITQVGAILPLSQRRDFPSYYGTRHRAGSGLAEATDALAVVVSEERGDIMLAKGAEMVEITSPAMLAQKINEHLGNGNESSPDHQRARLEIGLAAVVSILFVSGMWFSFSRGLETLTTLEIPIEYMNRNAQMEIFETSVNEAKVFLIGSGALIKSVKPEQVKVKIDLENAHLGTNSYTIGEKNVSLPPGVSLKRVEPASVEVVLDVPGTRILPVQVDWQGKLPKNLQLYEATVIPEKVRVVGGSQILKDITTIYTEPVRLETIKESGTLSASLALNTISLSVAPGSQDKVNIVYKIKPRG